MHVKQVQRWVITALIITTMVHFVGGLLIMAAYLDTPDGFWVLTIISVVVTALSIAGTLVLHRRRVLSPWLLFAVVPFIISWVWVR